MFGTSGAASRRHHVLGTNGLATIGAKVNPGAINRRAGWLSEIGRWAMHLLDLGHRLISPLGAAVVCVIAQVIPRELARLAAARRKSDVAMWTKAP